MGGEATIVALVRVGLVQFGGVVPKGWCMFFFRGYLLFMA